MPIKVPDWGSKDAKIVLIGEAPGFHEEQAREPFVGSSGYELKKWWEEVGLSRDMFYITNVYPFKPINNDISSIPAPEMQEHIDQLHDRLAELNDPWLIVPTGRIALEALTGYKEIMKRRGSIYKYTDKGGRIIKCIPTIHPAATLRMKKLVPVCIADWRRIAEELKTKEVELPIREHKIKPVLFACTGYKDFMDTNLSKWTYPISIDIETHPQSGITCVGFAGAKDYSFTIPLGIRRKIITKKKATKEQKERELQAWHDRISHATYHKVAPLDHMLTKKTQEKSLAKWTDEKKVTKGLQRLIIEWEKANKIKTAPLGSKERFITIGYWKTEEENDEALSIIKLICENDAPKIFQGGLYDLFWLKEYGITVKNYAWDTLSMHHCLVPNSRHALEFLASVYTREPYWKDEAKTAEESGKFATNSEALYTYNGKDCCVTRELFDVFHKMLQDKDKLEFYGKHYRNLQEPLLGISRHGIKIDNEARKKRQEELQEEFKGLTAKIKEETGKELLGKKKISPKKLADYLYIDLKLPKQMRKRGKGEKTASADSLALRTLMLRFPQVLQGVGDHILRANRISKLLEFLADGRVDNDGRFRAQYKFTTTTGRLASSENPRGTGSNLQNQDRELRGIFVGDTDMFLMDIDLSQVESRILYMLTRDSRLIDEARAKPWEYDMHTENARNIFGVENPDDEQRYFGKKTVHASQRGMRGKTMSEQLLNKGYVKTPTECDAMINNYLNSRQAISNVYFTETRTKVRDHRRLVNSWGREIEWPYDRFDDELYREAYSWLPQSEAADLLNQWGLVPLWEFIKTNKLKTRIHAQVHDSLLMSTNLEEGWYVANFLKQMLEFPRAYYGEPLSVPITVTIGKTWKGDQEFKKFPNKIMFDSYAKEILDGR